MVLEYFTSKKGKAKEEVQTPKSPILNEEEELFLKKITSEEAPPPLPARPVVVLNGGSGSIVDGRDAQTALMDGADKVPLPTSPAEGSSTDKKGKKKRDYWSYVPGLPARMKTMKQKKAGEDVKSAADNLKAGMTPAEQEALKEQEDLTAVLDQLNLAAVNNRVFSFTKESQELMEKFKLILKDLINGVPTAYDDLEKLLTGSEKQMKTTFAAMPPFIQTLIRSLPAKVTASLGPEVMAASAAKPSLEGSSKLKRAFVPSLKSLVGTQGAVVTMLRSIVNFLKIRFPLVASGTNILLSIAIFLLLFVFWYCHKRGRETRLEKERLAAGQVEGEVSESDDDGLEDSAIDEAMKQARAQGQEDSAGEHMNRRLDALPSVADLPDPVATPLPETPAQEKQAEAVKATIAK